MVEPGQEIELVANTAGEVVGALADESGVFKPTQEFGEMVAMRLHYRYYPKAVQRALGAAEKIRQSGLPRHACGEVPDPLLRAILVLALARTRQRLKPRPNVTEVLLHQWRYDHGASHREDVWRAEDVARRGAI
jgi:hypothetical protein